MANYDEMFRTSYFKVKNLAEFQTDMDKFSSEYRIEVWEELSPTDGMLVAVGSYGSCPTGYFETVDDEGLTVEEWVDIDFAEFIASHLEEGWLAIGMFNGNEKLRFITGGAWVVDSTGKVLTVDLTDIYKLAKTMGGKQPLWEY